MVSFNLLHHVLWVKQLKLLYNSVRFYQEKVPASFEVHEPVPWDQGQHVKCKGTVENVVVENLSTASHDLMVFNVLVLNKEIQNHYE